MNFLDRGALDAGRKKLADKGDEKEEESQEPAPKPKEGQFEITLDKDVYESDLVDQLTNMRDHYEARFADLESRYIEADARAEEQQFDNLVDSLGHADLFGKTGKENTKQLERRENLLIQVKAQQVGLEMFGRPCDLDASLVKRVTRMVYADELGKKELKAKTRKISSQSNGRQGQSATKATDPPETPREEARRMYKEMDAAQK